MTDNGLVTIAEQGGPDALENAWLEHLEDLRDAKYYLDALDALDEVHRRSVAPSLLVLLLEAYQSKERHADILATVRSAYPYRVGSKKVDLRQIANDSINSLYGGEDWYEHFLQLANIDDIDVEEGLERFDKLLSLLPGSPVYHRTGWGEGVITAIDMSDKSFHVKFRSEATERSMPFTTGLDVLQVLPAEDLRARLLVDQDGLQSDAKENPSRLLRAVARLHKGRAGSKEVKQWLCGAVIPQSGWASWWRKAKVAAAQDPYIAVDNPSRPVFVLRKRALSPADEAREAMSRCNDLKSLLDVVRGPLSLEPAEELKVAMLDALDAAVDSDTEDVVARAEAAIVLSRHERTTLAEAGKRLHRLSDNALGFGSLCARLNPAPVRREALEAYVAAEPQLWSDGVISNLSLLPPHILELVGDRLVAEGRGQALANRMHIFLLSPGKQPATVLRLAKRFAGGMLEGVEGAPSVVEVFTGILNLAETQAFPALRGKKDAKDTMEKVEDLFLGKRNNLLEAFTAEATRSDMERAMGVLARCRAMPDGIVTGIGAACKERYPDLVPRDETPFWDSNNIFCSRAGLERREEEYRVLLEEKIPENSEAIGKAASYGDLSENFEWTAAIEQQRQLTEKAAAMEAELKLARPIEDEELTEGVVSPGTKVTYEQDGLTKVIKILGPWDEGEDVVSYRAPVAAGMLGASAGADAELELPDGRVQVTINMVERAL